MTNLLVSVCVSAWSTYLRYYILTDATGLYMVLLAQMPEKAMQLRPAYIKKNHQLLIHTHNNTA